MYKKTIAWLGLAALLLTKIAGAAEPPSGAKIIDGQYFGQLAPGITPVKFAPGIISTDGRELNSVYSPDWSEFYFARSYGGGNYEIFVTTLDEGEWTEARTASFSTDYSNVDLAISTDNKAVYFGSDRPPPGASSSGTGFHLWKADRTADGWSDPIHLGAKINSGEHQIYPTVTTDGTLYFQARRADSFGGTDIYRSRLIDGEYQVPENLGPQVNSEANEGDVYVDPDEKFLIVSVHGRPDSLGSGDLYISFRSENGSWSTLKTMGPTINSPAIDFCPMVTPDGNYLFFSSGRDGDPDIYWVSADVIEHQRSD